MAKAIGHPIAKYASLIMSGQTLKDLNFTEEPKLNHVAVKEAVLPFDKFPGEACAQFYRQGWIIGMLYTATSEFVIEWHDCGQAGSKKPCVLKACLAWLQTTQS